METRAAKRKRENDKKISQKQDKQRCIEKRNWNVKVVLRRVSIRDSFHKKVNVDDKTNLLLDE